MKLCPKIILEGTRLTHKTDIALALNEHARIVGPRKYRYHSPLVSAEWCGFTNYPWGRGLINFEAHEETLAIDTFNTWLSLFGQLRYYSWIVDRFHISTQVFQSMQRGKSYDFAWLEQGLKELNFRLVFCMRSPDSFLQARAERVKVSGKPSQYDDLQVFIDEQEVMKRYVGASSLESLQVDISDDDVGGSVERIADWMEVTGGLTMREG
ncbi:MAG: hypothetical protein A2136_07920 [Chloroflexi bacterium RBG_16_54_11]|nr:MAG: hypothetical protein A2136_07920 [Chloroflexi bacterium RBG_16_54_11]